MANLKKLKIVSGLDLTPYLSKYKHDKIVLVKDEVRNAQGNATISILNRKNKVYTTFRPLTASEMATILTAVEPFVLQMEYLDSYTNTIKTGNFYTGTPSAEMEFDLNGKVMYKGFDLNFVEL